MKFLSMMTGMTVAASVMLATLPAQAQDIPEGYPADYAELIAKAKQEGRLSLYSATDEELAKGLLDAFTKKYGIKIDFTDMGTNNAYSRTVAEAEANQTGGDVVWSSAMDLQLKLATDGYAETYQSPEIKNLPSWANYKNMVYATTVEPIGVIYNTKAFPEGTFPKTRADLVKYVQEHTDTLKNKMATFDPEKSGIGFLMQTNDARNSDSFWDLAKAMGAAKVKTYAATGTMRETVVSGENVMAINVIGSYALDWVKNTPNLGVAFGTDYTAAFSRPAVIPRGAPHPNAARLFLDFMLSKEGQTALAQHGLPSVRTDLDGDLDLDSLNEMVGGNLKPIALDDALLDYLKPQNRIKFFREWNKAIK
ncbi:ABC transporter substrate-binding protein [Bartonella sp. LJL80]